MVQILHPMLQCAIKGVNSAIEKLSTGSRINFAKDDTAGLAIDAIKSRVAEFIDGIKKYRGRTNTATVADAALNTVSSLILRSRELSVLAANDTYSKFR